jgi:hypothetical protein
MTEMNGHIDVQRLYAELSDILSEKFGVKVTFKLTPKPQEPALDQSKATA